MVACISSSLSLLSSVPWCKLNHILFFYSPVNGHLDSSPILVTTNSVANIIIFMSKSLHGHMFPLLLDRYRSQTAGLYSKFIFTFLRDHKLFQRCQTT